LAAKYNTIAGFIQFDVNEREVSGQNVRDIVVQAVGSGGRNVRITIWPEYSAVALDKGMFVVASGKFTESESNGKTYLNLSASELLVLPAIEKGTAGVANALPDSAAADDDFDF